MIRLGICRSIELAQWEQLLAQCGGHALHLPRVHCADHARRDLRFVVADKGDTTIACGLAVEQSRRIFGWPVGRKTLSLPTALALHPEAAPRRAEIYGELAASAARLGYARLQVQRTWGEDFSASNGLSKWIVSRGVDFTVDLTRTTDDLLAAMHKYHRKNVRRAQRSAVEFVQDTSEEGILRLRELQICAAGRKGDRFGVGEEALFRQLYHSIYQSGPGDIVFAKLDGECVAGLAYLVGDRKAQTVRSGSNDEGNKHHAMYLLQFDLMVRLKEAGVELLNIGAVPAAAVEPDHPQHGLYQFKRGFGGQEHLRTAIDVDLAAFLASQDDA